MTNYLLVKVNSSSNKPQRSYLYLKSINHQFWFVKEWKIQILSFIFEEKAKMLMWSIFSSLSMSVWPVSGFVWPQ